MPASVHVLPTFKPDPDVIAVFERLLEQAKSGELTGGLVLAQDTVGGVTYEVVGIADRFKVLGFLTLATSQLAHPLSK